MKLPKFPLLLLLGSCIHLTHIAPEPRSSSEAVRATVQLEVTCSTDDPFEINPLAVGELFRAAINWRPPTSGTGVVISERHVLTAAHLVSCPTIPDVTAFLSDGRRIHMYVELDDAAFGSGTDVARLESASAGNLKLGVFPPALTSDAPEGYVGDTLCAATLHGWTCGTRDPYGLTPDVAFGLRSIPGDSGAGVYNDVGQLVGLVVSGGLTTAGDAFTRYVPIPDRWLVGT